MQQSHDAVVPGEACTHHKNAHTTNEGGDVAHVGEAVPENKEQLVTAAETRTAHKLFTKD